MLYSCKKEIKSLFDVKENNIEWAKEYFNNTLQKTQNFKLNTNSSISDSKDEKNTLLLNEKNLNWAQSKAGITMYYDFVEIPMTYKHKISYTIAIGRNPNVLPVANKKIIDASYDRLIIYKDKKGKIDQRIVSFIPDEAYLIKHKNNISHNSINKLDNDFVGYLHYKDWDGKVLFVLRIENGKPVKKYDMLKSIKGKIKNVNNSKISGGKEIFVEDGGEKCYFMSWSWYQDCYEVSPELMYCEEPIIYNLQYYEIPCDPPGDGGGGGDNPPDCLNVSRFATGDCPEDPPTQSDPLDSILKDTCLNAAQMTSLRTMFSSYLSGQGESNVECVQKAVFNKIKTLGKKFGFCIDANQVSVTGAGSYKPGTGIIYYKFEEGIPNVGLFGHEFFHGFQDAFYTGGTTQYTIGTGTGYPNIEFEQALFYDIVYGSGDASAMGSTASITVRNNYQAWISSITNNNTTYPKQFSDFGGQYYTFLTLFYENSPYANIGAVHINLQPLALLNIFSSSYCK